MLLNDKSRQEVISREKKDRRDFEQIAALASRMGLHRYHFFYSFIFPGSDYINACATSFVHFNIDI